MKPVGRPSTAARSGRPSSAASSIRPSSAASSGRRISKESQVGPPSGAFNRPSSAATSATGKRSSNADEHPTAVRDAGHVKGKERFSMPAKLFASGRNSSSVLAWKDEYLKGNLPEHLRGRNALVIFAQEECDSGLQLLRLRKLLEQKYVDANAVEPSFGWSAAHFFASDGKELMMKRVIDFAANIHSVCNQENTTLHVASRGGHCEIVELLILSNACVEARNKNGWTALTWGVINGHEDVVSTLIAAEAEIDVADLQGRTPLMWAARHGFARIVHDLLDAHADMSLRDMEDMTVGYHAHEYLDIQRTFIETETANCRLLDDCKSDALHSAFHALAAGAQINVADESGWTPLKWALANGSFHLSRFLIQLGARTRGVQSVGGNYLSFKQAHMSEMYKLPEELSALLCVNDRFLFAAREQQFDAVAIELENGAFVNCRDQNLRTALMWAAFHGNAATVILLASAQAKLDLRDTQGFAAIHHAACSGDVESVAALYHYGAKMRLRTYDGCFLPHIAAQGDNQAVLQLLLAARSSIESENMDSETPLLRSASKGSVSACSTLVAFGANTLAKDNNGRTPLAAAVVAGHVGIVQAMLQPVQMPKQVITEDSLESILDGMSRCDLKAWGKYTGKHEYLDSASSVSQHSRASRKSGTCLRRGPATKLMQRKRMPSSSNLSIKSTTTDGHDDSRDLLCRLSVKSAGNDVHGDARRMSIELTSDITKSPRGDSKRHAYPMATAHTHDHSPKHHAPSSGIGNTRQSTPTSSKASHAQAHDHSPTPEKSPKWADHTRHTTERRSNQLEVHSLERQHSSKGVDHAGRTSEHSRSCHAHASRDRSLEHHKSVKTADARHQTERHPKTFHASPEHHDSCKVAKHTRHTISQHSEYSNSPSSWGPSSEHHTLSKDSSHTHNMDLSTHSKKDLVHSVGRSSSASAQIVAKGEQTCLQRSSSSPSKASKQDAPALSRAKSESDKRTLSFGVSMSDLLKARKNKMLPKSPQADSELLEKRLHDVQSRTQFGKYTLILLAHQEHDHLAKHLATPKAPEVLLKQVDSDGRTPLALSAYRRKIDVMQILLVKKALVNASDEQGNTPLILAASQNHRASVECLLAYGPDVAKQNLEHKTALDVTKNAGIRRLLQQHLVKKRIQSGTYTSHTDSPCKQPRDSLFRFRLEGLPELSADLLEGHIRALMRRMNAADPERVDVKVDPFTAFPVGCAYVEYNSAEKAASLARGRGDELCGTVVQIIPEFVLEKCLQL